MPTNNLSPYKLGKEGEEIALRYLKKKKYKIIKKGFRLLKGEIDIIAYDQKTLVFIEVKTRKNFDYGHPEESVTYLKQKQIKKIASGFMSMNNLTNVECRFDVISIMPEKPGSYKLCHIKNAF